MNLSNDWFYFNLTIINSIFNDFHIKYEADLR